MQSVSRYSCSLSNLTAGMSSLHLAYAFSPSIRFVLEHVLPCPVHSCSLLLINVLSLLSSLLFSFHVFSLLFLLFFCLLCSPLRLTSLHFLGIPCPCLCNHLLTLFCYLLIYTSLVHSYDILFRSFTLFHSPIFSSHGMILDSSFNN